MAIASSIDIVLENDDIVVLGPPTSIDIAVDIGPQGDRGSRTFTGSVDPNTYTSAQFETVFGIVPIYGDIFIQVNSGSDYGKYYIYNPATSQWDIILTLNNLLENFFIVNDDFVLSGKNGGTGAANTGKSLLLGGPQTIFNGNNTVTITSTGNTSVTLPTSGTLATTGNLSQFASTTSAQLAGIISDETGTGSLVFATNPTFSGTLTAPTVLLTTSDTSSTSSHYFVETGSDGIIRPKTLANTRTEIVTTSAVNAASATVVGTITSGVWNGSSISATYIDSAIARLASPTFTGTPEAPTASIGTNTTQIATTAFVNDEISNDAVLLAGSTMTGTLVLPAATTSISSARLPHGTAPTSPTDGDIWTTSTGMYVQVNGTTVGPLGTGGGGGGGGTTNTEDVIGISFFTMGA